MRSSTILVTLAALSTSALAQTQASLALPSDAVAALSAAQTNTMLLEAFFDAQTVPAVTSAYAAVIAAASASKTPAIESAVANYLIQVQGAITGSERAAATSAFGPAVNALNSAVSKGAGPQGSHQSAAVGLAAGALGGLAAFVMAL